LTIPVTLADANILISRTLRDYFVYAAKLGALDIHWSETILDETTRNLIASPRTVVRTRRIGRVALFAQ
jgi:hypothetical protein